MVDLVDVLEHELERAVEVKDRDALKRYVTMLVESLAQREQVETGYQRLESEIKTLAQVMREGFRQIDKRFEAVDRRFESVDKRFEAVDRRFEDLIHAMDKRFEDLTHAMDKRFEAVDKRFEDMNRRIGFMAWFVPTIITLVVVVLKFL